MLFRPPRVRPGCGAGGVGDARGCWGPRPCGGRGAPPPPERTARQQSDYARRWGRGARRTRCEGRAWGRRRGADHHAGRADRGIGQARRPRARRRRLHDQAVQPQGAGRSRTRSFAAGRGDAPAFGCDPSRLGRRARRPANGREDRGSPRGSHQDRISDPGDDGEAARPNLHARSAARRGERRGLRVIRAGDRRPHQEHPAEDRAAAGQAQIRADCVRSRLPFRGASRPMRTAWRPPPRRRPPWWPENQPWPPPRRWRRGGLPFFWRMGCLILGVIGLVAVVGALVTALVITLLSWLLGPTALSQSTAEVVLIITFLLLGASAVVAQRGIRRFSQPMDNLIEAAGRIEKGDYSAHLSETGPRELRSVARAFNAISARLKVSDEHRRSFLADVAHELRTPPPSNRGQADSIADRVYPGDPDRS